MKIKLLTPEAIIPKRAENGAAGFDLYTPRAINIHSGRNIVPLDIAMAINPGFEGHIRPRSGFSLKGMEGQFDATSAPMRFDADVLQGTIDSSYRGNVGVIIKSYEKFSFTIPAGTRIAQMVISPCYTEAFEQVEELNDTERGIGGFGHTGTH